MPSIRMRDFVVAALLVVSAPFGVARAQTPPTATPTGAPTDTPTGTATATPPADTDPGIAEARRRYAQGVEFYRRQRYAEAVAEFTEAYSRWTNPTILFSLGQAYEGLGEINRAIETYRRYLDTTPADDARRSAVEATITQLERQLAIVHVQCNVLATLYVDGELAGEAPGDARISTGRHELEVRAEGFVTQTQTILLAGGTERTISFRLELVPIATSTQIVQVASEPFRFPRTVFYTGVGLTAASAATWGTLATMTVVRARDYNDDLDRTNLDRSHAREIARSSNIALGFTGGFAAATAIVGIFTDFHPDDDEEDAAPAVSASVEPVVGGAILNARWTR